MSREFGSLALLFMLAGCTVSAKDGMRDAGPSNTCSSDADCDNGNCNQQVCQTLNGQLESLLLEVTPPADSGLPHIPFVKHIEDVPISGGRQVVSLVRAARVSGRLTASGQPACVRRFYGPEGALLSPSTDGLSLPVSVTLTPRNRLLGLPTQSYLADATLPALNMGAVEYVFELQVPAATYDVYVEPVRHEVESMDPSVPAEACRVPPQLFRRELIDKETVLDYPAAPTTSLELKVVFPQSAGDLDGWEMEIIEPLSGNPLSSTGVLANPALVPLPKDTGKGFEYLVSLAYSGVNERGNAEVAVDGANDLIRLRPPHGLVAPTIFFDRTGVGLFAQQGQDDAAEISNFTKLPSPVTIEGQMTTRDEREPTPGRIDLVSTEIFGVDAGIFASFKTSVAVDARGFFRVSIPPGKYRVWGVPSQAGGLAGGELSSYEAAWDVSADAPFQAGRLLELPRRTEVRGQTSLPSAEIQAVASPQTILPFDQVFGAAAFIPRATPGLVDAAGRFVVEADPGSFDISLRPPESSGFAWFVRPGFEVQLGSPQQQLGGLAPQQPSLFTGSIVVGEGSTPPTVPLALIRAYAYLDENLAYTGDPMAARSVIQVAQTRTDEQGGFRLLVPAALGAK
jgi:hypothetical protein